MNSKTQVVPKVSDKKLYIYITIIKPLPFFFPFEEKPFKHSNGCSLLWVYVFQNLKFLLLNAYKRLKKKKKNCSILRGKQKSKPKFYIMSHFKKNHFVWIFFSEPTIQFSKNSQHQGPSCKKYTLFYIKKFLIPKFLFSLEAISFLILIKTMSYSALDF